MPITQTVTRRLAPVAVGLVRCSTDLQEHSTQDQERAIAAWATESGRELLQVFRDEGVSGCRFDRPGLSALLAFLEASPTQGVVVCWKRNRLARPEEAADGIWLEQTIRHTGWDLHFLHGSTPSGNDLVDTLMGVIEHHQGGEFLRSLATDTLRGLARRVLEGGVVIGVTPYGYAREVTWPNGSVQTLARSVRQRTKEARSVRLVSGDPREVEVVRWIYDRYVSGGQGTPAVASALNTDSVPSPRGRAWSSTAVRRLLRNPVYAGDLVWNRSTQARFMQLVGGKAAKARTGGRQRRNDPGEWLRVPDNHQPLVERGVWEEANALLSQRGRAKGGQRRAATRYPLSGLAKCGTCGSPMTGSLSGGRGRYICTGYVEAHRCAPYTLRQVELERAVLRKLRDAYHSIREELGLRERVREILQRRLGPAPVADTKPLEEEHAQLESKIEQAVENMGTVGPTVAKRIAARIERWTKRQRELDAEIVKVRERAAIRVDLDEAADEIVGLLDSLYEVGLEAPRQARRRLFHATVEHLELRFETEDRGPGRRRKHHFTGGTVTVRSPLAELAAPPPSQECLAGQGGPAMPSILTDEQRSQRRRGQARAGDASADGPSLGRPTH